MAEVQKVIYQIVVSTAGMSEAVAKARAEMAALRAEEDKAAKASGKAADEAADRHRKAAKRRIDDLKDIRKQAEKAADALKDLNKIQQKAQQATSGGAGPSSGPAGVNYTSQLGVIITELAAIRAAIEKQKTAAASGSKGRVDRRVDDVDEARSLAEAEQNRRINKGRILDPVAAYVKAQEEYRKREEAEYKRLNRGRILDPLEAYTKAQAEYRKREEAEHRRINRGRVHDPDEAYGKAGAEVDEHEQNRIAERERLIREFGAQMARVMRQQQEELRRANPGRIHDQQEAERRAYREAEDRIEAEQRRREQEVRRANPGRLHDEAEAERRAYREAEDREQRAILDANRGRLHDVAEAERRAYREAEDRAEQMERDAERLGRLEAAAYREEDRRQERLRQLREREERELERVPRGMVDRIRRGQALIRRDFGTYRDERNERQAGRDSLLEQRRHENREREAEFLLRLNELIREGSRSVPGFQRRVPANQDIADINPNRMSAEDFDRESRAMREHLLAERESIISAHQFGRARSHNSRIIRDAVRDLRVLNTETRRLGREERETDTLGTRRERGRNFLRTAGTNLMDLNDSIVNQGSGRMSRMQIIIAAVITLLIVLIPLIATATAALGALVSAAVVAGAAIGVFALGAIGNITKFVKALKEARETGASIPAPMLSAANAFDRLRDTYNRFTRAAERPVFRVLAEAFGVLERVLPRIITVVTSASDGISQALKELDGSLSGDRFAAFVGLLNRIGPRMISTIVGAIRELVAGFGELALSFEPFVDFFITGLLDMMTGFKEWARELGSSNGFYEFMNYAITQGPVVMSTLKALGSLIIDLGVAAAPVGGFLMFVIRALARLADVATRLGVLRPIIVALLSFVGLRVVLLILNSLVLLFINLGRAALLLAARLETLYATFLAGRAATTAALVTMGLLGAAILAAVVAYTLLSNKSDEAAAAAERHRAAVQQLAQELDASGGTASDEFRKQKLSDFTTQKVEVEKTFDEKYIPGVNGPKSTTVLEQAKAAGIGVGDLVGGAAGDDQARNRSIATFDKKIEAMKREQQQYEKMGPGYKKTVKDLDDQIRQMQAARDSYKNNTAGAADLVAAQADLAAATRTTADGMAVQSEAAARLREKLDALRKTDQRRDDIQAALDAQKKARDAAEEYSDALREQTRLIEDNKERQYQATLRVSDAEERYTDALERQRRATENVNRAREQAAQKLEKLRDRLRDIKGEEEDNAISVARARENLQKVLNDASSTDLDIREARRQLERAENAQVDSREENEWERLDAEREMAKGVEGSAEVIDAIKAERDAKKEVAAADHERALAKQNLQRTNEDVKESEEDATTRVNDLKKAVGEANTEFAKMLTIAQLTPAELEKVGAAYETLNSKLEKGLSLKGMDDLAGRTGEALRFFRAFQLIAENPSMSIEDALGIVDKEIGTEEQRRKKFERMTGETYAEGGPVEGPGGPTTDSVPALLSAGEHVWTAAETVAIGGHRMMEALRRSAKAGRINPRNVTSFLWGMQQPFAEGGPVQPLGEGPGRPFDVALLTAALDAGARSVSQPTAMPVSAVSGPVINNSRSHGGLTIGDVTINNPIREPAGDSMYRTLRRFAIEYEN